jgi:putative transposase
VKFPFIDAEKAHYSIVMLCRVLRVSRAGFYAWIGRPPSPRAVEDARLSVLVREAHERSRRTYGSPRVHAELAAQEVFVSRKRVIRLMQAEKIVARQRRRYRCTTVSDHDQPFAANLLARKFEAERPNQKWVGDTTELVTTNGRLFLAVILDLFSRYVVGWSLSPVNDRHLTIAALKKPILRRCPGADLIHHSDQGSTYAAEDYQDVLDAHGITCSMSRRGEASGWRDWRRPPRMPLASRPADRPAGRPRRRP